MEIAARVSGDIPAVHAEGACDPGVASRWLVRAPLLASALRTPASEKVGGVAGASGVALRTKVHGSTPPSDLAVRAYGIAGVRRR